MIFSRVGEIIELLNPPPRNIYREFRHLNVKTMTSWDWKVESVLGRFELLF